MQLYLRAALPYYIRSPSPVAPLKKFMVVVKKMWKYLAKLVCVCVCVI